MVAGRRRQHLGARDARDQRQRHAGQRHGRQQHVAQAGGDHRRVAGQQAVDHAHAGDRAAGRARPASARPPAASPGRRRTAPAASGPARRSASTRRTGSASSPPHRSAIPAAPPPARRPARRTGSPAAAMPARAAASPETRSSTSSSAGRLLWIETPRSPRSASTHEAAVLHPDRLIEAKLLAQPLQLLVGCVIAQQQLRDIARQQVHGDEHHDADADQHEQQLDQAGSDVAWPLTPSAMWSATDRRRSPARDRGPHARCRSACG